MNWSSREIKFNRHNEDSKDKGGREKILSMTRDLILSDFDLYLGVG